MRKIFILILLIITLDMSYATPLQIGFIPKGNTHAFWKEMETGAKRAAKTLNVNLIWRGPRSEDGIDAQIKILDYFVREGVQGIILAPNSTTKLQEKLEEIQKKGIKIIIADSPLAASFIYIGTNNFKAGEKMGNELVKKFPNTKKILLFRYSKEHASTTQREEGFLNTVKSKLPSVKVIDNFYSGMTVGEAEHNLINILKKDSDIDLIFTPNESGTEGTIKALKVLGKNKIITHMGFDFSKAIRDALESNDLYGTLIQDPELIGYKSIELMIKIINLKEVSLINETPAIIVSKKNLGNKEVLKLINPFLISR